MSLIALIRKGCRIASEDQHIRGELEEGKTKTLYELKEAKGINQLKWPDQWWFEDWLRKRLKMGLLEGGLLFYLIFALIPKMLLVTHIHVLGFSKDHETYVMDVLFGLINDFLLIIIPLTSVRAVFEKLKHMAMDINYYVESRLVTAPASVRFFKEHQLQSIDRAYLRRFFKPRLMPFLQTEFDIAFNRECQIASFVIASALMLIATWVTRMPYWGPPGLEVLDFLLLRFLVWGFLYGIAGVFFWSTGATHFVLLALAWIINLVHVPRHRPLSMHYEQLSDLFASVFSYVGSMLGLGSIWLLRGALLRPFLRPSLAREYYLTLAISVCIITIAVMTTIVLSGSYSMHMAMDNSKRRKLDILELEMKNQKKLPMYRIALEEYRVTSNSGTWPVTSSTFLQMVVMGTFSVIGSILGAYMSK